MSSEQLNGPRYDPEQVRQHYDELGEREWARFNLDHDNPLAPGNQINLHLHLWHLRRHIRGGDNVLEIGAGPGRFTIELARLGARVSVADISPAQLDLNRRKVQEAGYEDAVVDRALVDVVDLSTYATARFDAVVCYGGVLSYVFDRADQALSELLRVTMPGARVLLSVMSLLGTSRRFLGQLLDLARLHGPGLIDQLFTTHDQIGVIGEGHQFRYYTWASLQALLARQPCTLLDASAANFLAIGNNESLLEPLLHTHDSELWDAYLAWEVESCRQPGAIDAGTHIIAVVQKRIAP